VQALLLGAMSSAPAHSPPFHQPLSNALNPSFRKRPVRNPMNTPHNKGREGRHGGMEGGGGRESAHCAYCLAPRRLRMAPALRCARAKGACAPAPKPPPPPVMRPYQHPPPSAITRTT